MSEDKMNYEKQEEFEEQNSNEEQDQDQSRGEDQDETSGSERRSPEEMDKIRKEAVELAKELKKRKADFKEKYRDEK